MYRRKKLECKLKRAHEDELKAKKKKWMQLNFNCKSTKSKSLFDHISVYLAPNLFFFFFSLKSVFIWYLKTWDFSFFFYFFLDKNNKPWASMVWVLQTHVNIL